MNIQEVLKERGGRYGKFSTNAQVSQRIKEVLRNANTWNKCTEAQKEALEMIAHKMGRIVNGDPSYKDSWVDIAGYANLIVEDV